MTSCIDGPKYIFYYYHISIHSTYIYQSTLNSHAYIYIIEIEHNSHDMSISLKSIIKCIPKSDKENTNDNPLLDTSEIIATISKMKTKLSHTKYDIRDALKVFDAIHNDITIEFQSIQLPTERNVARQLKIDLNLLCNKALELCLNQTLNMNWWIYATRKLIKQSIIDQKTRKERRRTLTHIKSEREARIHALQLKQRQRTRSLIPPSQNRGTFKRITAYQSIHGVPAWPIGHRKGSSVTRVGLELDALKGLRQLKSVRCNQELMHQLNELYEKLYELWETQKIRKFARKARALIKHKCSQLSASALRSEYGCPWAIEEMLEMKQERMKHDRLKHIRYIRRSVSLCQQPFGTEMEPLRRIWVTIEDDAFHRQIKHQKASDIQRKSVDKGLQLKQRLERKQVQLEMQLTSDDDIIGMLEEQISNLLNQINKHDLNLDQERLQKIHMYVPM
eukprot:221320_1